MKGYAAFVIFIGGLIVLTYRTKALLFVGIFFPLATSCTPSTSGTSN